MNRLMNSMIKVIKVGKKVTINVSKKAAKTSGYKSYAIPIFSEAAETISKAHETVVKSDCTDKDSKQLFEKWKSGFDDQQVKSHFRKTIALKYTSIFAAILLLSSVLYVDRFLIQSQLIMMSLIFAMYAAKYSYTAYVIKNENCVSFFEFAKLK